MPAKKIGLALSGGGARGFAHIGAISALLSKDIKIDFIAGTSAGAIVGGAMASGMSLEAIIAMAAAVRWRNMTRPSLSPLGLLSNAPMGKFLGSHLVAKRFEDAAIPFAAIACDFETGEEVAMTDRGDIAFAIRASCAVPGIFAPLQDDGRLHVDGGVVSPVPTDAVRQMGADVVIAVDLLACGATFRSRPRTAFGMMFGSAMLLLRAASRNQHYQADVVIVPQIAHLRPDEISKRDEFIQLGEAAALEKMAEIIAITS
jgi:NTE family protein